MSFILKIFLIFTGITLAFVLIYEAAGHEIEALFSQEKCIEYFSRIKPFAWLVGILLLISDILLPVPATGIMAALGAVYGPLPGAVISTAGSMGAGLTGYAAARFLGRRGGRWLASEEEMDRFAGFFNTWGAYAVILSRAVPVMPEVISILAGLGKMKFSRFAGALFLGTLPVALIFSWMGALSGPVPGMGIAGALVLPLVIWPFFLKWSRI